MRSRTRGTSYKWPFQLVFRSSRFRSFIVWPQTSCVLVLRLFWKISDVLTSSDARVELIDNICLQSRPVKAKTRTGGWHTTCNIRIYKVCFADKLALHMGWMKFRFWMIELVLQGSYKLWDGMQSADLVSYGMLWPVLVFITRDNVTRVIFLTTATIYIPPPHYTLQTHFVIRRECSFNY